MLTRCAAGGDAPTLVSVNVGQVTRKENLKEAGRGEIHKCDFKEESILLLRKENPFNWLLCGVSQRKVEAPLSSITTVLVLGT